MIESACAETRELIRLLEGSTVQRVAVAAGEYQIEIERAAQPGAPEPKPPDDDEDDVRIPVLAPLVGTFYRAAKPGAKPYVEVGETVEAGQTVCIVEAMKTMNQVTARQAGRVVELKVENGERVEFEQVLMYLAPSEP